MSRRGLIVVRNGVTHDARVLREAATMAQAGLEPLVLGVQTTAERRRRSVEAGFPVLRLDPMASWRRTLSRVHPAWGVAAQDAGAPPTPAPAATGPPAAPGPAPGRRAHVRRLLVAMDFYRQAIGVARRLRPAVVHCNDHNTMWVGVAARLMTGARVIYDSHELWPDRNGRPEWRPALLAGEALFVRAADLVMTTSPGYADVIARRYRVARPAVVRNVPAGLPGGAPEAQPPDGDPVAVYVGGILRGRGIEQAIDALPLAPGVRLRCIGPGAGAYRAELARRAAERGVGDRVELVEPVAPDAVVASLRGAAMGLMLIQPVCLSYELTLPNKMFEYAAAGLPMVVSDLPVMAGITREYGCGVVVAPADPDAIAAAMQRLLDPQLHEACAAGARRLAAEVTWDGEQARLREAYAAL